MLFAEFYDGQGLGNQIWVYASLRAIAQKNKMSFSLIHPEKFKGFQIFDLDFKSNGDIKSIPINFYREKAKFDLKSRIEISPHDPHLSNLTRDTKVDGNLQSLSYFAGCEIDIFDWLKFQNNYKINLLTPPSKTCIIHVRGGDYLSTVSALPRSYYLNAIAQMKLLHGELDFYAVTDDLNYCKYLLPKVKIIGSTPKLSSDPFMASHHRGGTILDDFAIINSAEYLIISSSTFSFWAAYLNKSIKEVIAPKYWFAHSISNGWWGPEECIHPDWMYLDRDNNLLVGSKCKELALKKIGVDNLPKKSFFLKIKSKSLKFLKG